mgnify:CR=1 FL=1
MKSVMITILCAFALVAGAQSLSKRVPQVYSVENTGAKFEAPEITYPKTGKAPYPLMIGSSMLALPRQLFADRPIAIMNFHEKQVNDYGQWGPHHDRGEHCFDRLYPELKDNGAYSEWAWALSVA